MDLDFATLTVAGAFVGLVSGCLLSFAWTQYGRGRAALMFGASHLVAGTAILLLAAGQQQLAIATFSAQLLFVLAGSLVLLAVLAFERRQTPYYLFALVGIGIAAMIWLRTATGELDPSRAIQLALVSALFMTASTVLWRSRREHLQSRTALAVLLALHGAVQFVGLVEILALEALPSGVPTLSNWYGAIHAESMIYFIGTTLFMVSMLKERSEARHRDASRTDPLTGLSNRRAFFYEAERALVRCGAGKATACVLVIDLDHFKRVNDGFGHATGDSVLKILADTLREVVREEDVVGRIGGEEFALVASRAGASDGMRLAEQIRAGFEANAKKVDGFDVEATLSVGAAVAGPFAAGLDETLRLADEALYLAKLHGRNRVQLAVASRPLKLVVSA